MTTINPYGAPQSEVARPQQTTHALRWPAVASGCWLPCSTPSCSA